MNREMRENPGRMWLSLLVVLLLVGCSVWSKVIYVDDDATAPGDGASWATAYRFLQDALTDAATAGEPVEIRVAQGLYKPDENAAHAEGTGDTVARFTLADGMSLLGGYGGQGVGDPNARGFDAYETILSGDLAGNDAEVSDPMLLRDDPTRDENSWQVVFAKNGQIRLAGFTITGGTAGGAFFDQYPREATNDVVVSDCVFHGNRGSQDDVPTAGALTTWLLTIEPGVVVRRCSFFGNAGTTGALGAQDVTLDQCHFERNYSWGEWGGAVDVSGNSMILDCVFTGNSAKRAAGALYVDASGTDLARVLRCKFHDNRAAQWGGGLACHGNADVRECVFTANEAGMRGGAGYDAGNVKIDRCMFAGNRSGEHGGVWFSWDISSLEIVGCTAVANCAPEGLFLGAAHNIERNLDPVSILNCVLSDGDNEIWSDTTPVDVAYTCLGGAGRVSAAPGEWLALGEGNIEADPCFVDPGSWDDNGTADDPNDDVFVEGDYHLKSQAGRWDEASGSWVVDDVTSPCIDAGDPNSAIGYEPFPNGGIVNMGAYGGTAEASKSYFDQPVCETVIAGDLNGDCIVDLADLAILMRHWLEVGMFADQ